mgnify:CR=1 FL=1
MCVNTGVFGQFITEAVTALADDQEPAAPFVVTSDSVPAPPGSTRLRMLMPPFCGSFKRYSTIAFSQRRIVYIELHMALRYIQKNMVCASRLQCKEKSYTLDHVNGKRHGHGLHGIASYCELEAKYTALFHRTFVKRKHSLCCCTWCDIIIIDGRDCYTSTNLSMEAATTWIGRRATITFGIFAFLMVVLEASKGRLLGANDASVDEQLINDDFCEF